MPLARFDLQVGVHIADDCKRVCSEQGKGADSIGSQQGKDSKGFNLGVPSTLLHAHIFFHRNSTVHGNIKFERKDI